MDILNSIESMLNEIRDYSGNFGDPATEHIDFEPIEILQNENNELGAGIALLVNFSNHIDNSTYEDALIGSSAKDLRKAIENDYCSKYPPLRRAFDAAFESELSYSNSLREVYCVYIQ